MKICCLSNTGKALPKSYLKQEFCYTEETEFQVTVGKEYVVYALYEWEGNVWYYICDDNYICYPQQNPSPLFEISDNSISKYWKFNLEANGLLTLAFSEWFDDPLFYDKLTDMDEQSIVIFRKIKALIDEEALH